MLWSDSVKSHGVRRDILILSKLTAVMGILVAIAGIVTPLGLHEAMVEANSFQAPFKYLKDVSSFGYGTPPRSNGTFSRMCGWYEMLPCPFTQTVAIIVVDSNGNGTVEYPYGYDITIPDFLLDVYSSGVDYNTTVSNYFDIEWRRYQLTSNKRYNNGSAYVVGAFRLMSSMALDNSIRPVEGLIVDTVHGGIGFRNHTVPIGFQYGASWDEDILFVEPETVCVDTNTTIDYTVSSSPNSTLGVDIVDLVLTDRGGFINLNHTYPEANLSDTQTNPDLYGRAYKAALMTNAWTMFFLNITNVYNETTGQRAFSYLNSRLGQSFPIPVQDSSTFYTSMGIDHKFDSHLNMQAYVSNESPFAASTGHTDNPFGVTEQNFTLIGKTRCQLRMCRSLTANLGEICSGAGGADIANITNILVSCGLMHGVPRRKDPGSGIQFDSKSEWSQPLYGCASAVKASIKTVSFTYNGTNDLQSLNITNIRSKDYKHNDSRPLWGVENSGNFYSMADINLIWGIISPKYENHPNVSSVRQEHLYLPGYSSVFNQIYSLDPVNSPGTSFYIGAMGDTYGNSITPKFDYSGTNNMAMWVRWQNLTSSAEAASLIPNLIFTDFAAAAVVGTKGVLGSHNKAADNLVALSIIPIVRKVRYNYLFAIPAFLVVTCLVIMLLVAVVATIRGRSSIAIMRLRLQQTSPGRIFTIFLYPDQNISAMDTKTWSKIMGKQIVDCSAEIPVGEEGHKSPGKIPTVELRIVEDMAVPLEEEESFLSGQDDAGYEPEDRSGREILQRS